MICCHATTKLKMKKETHFQMNTKEIFWSILCWLEGNQKKEKKRKKKEREKKNFGSK
jgi:hypothetical protein